MESKMVTGSEDTGFKNNVFGIYHRSINLMYPESVSLEHDGN